MAESICRRSESSEAVVIKEKNMQQVKTVCKIGDHPPLNVCKDCKDKCTAEAKTAKELLAEVAREKYMSPDEAIRFLIAYYRHEERQRREASQLVSADCA
jgi:hypothetical protein